MAVCSVENKHTEQDSNWQGMWGTLAGMFLNSVSHPSTNQAQPA